MSSIAFIDFKELDLPENFTKKDILNAYDKLDKSFSKSTTFSIYFELNDGYKRVAKMFKILNNCSKSFRIIQLLLDDRELTMVNLNNCILQHRDMQLPYDYPIDMYSLEYLTIRDWGRFRKLARPKLRECFDYFITNFQSPFYKESIERLKMDKYYKELGIFNKLHDKKGDLK